MAQCFGTDGSKVVCNGSINSTADIAGITMANAAGTAATSAYFDVTESHFKVRMGDNAEVDLLKLISNETAEFTGNHLNGSYKRIGQGFGNYMCYRLDIPSPLLSYRGVGLETAGMITSAIPTTATDKCKGMLAAQTDQYSIGRYLRGFSPFKVNQTFDPGVGTVETGCPILGYNPLLQGTNIPTPCSCQGGSQSFTHSTSLRYIKIKATNVNGYGALQVQTSSDKSSGTTYNLTQTTFRNGIIPNRIGLLANAGGGGGGSANAGSYGGGGAGAGCAIVLNTYCLKENDARYYLIDMGATVYATRGGNASDVTITYYNESGTPVSLVTLGGGKAPSSGNVRGNGGNPGIYGGENTYWGRLLNCQTSAPLANDMFPGAAGGQGRDANITTSYLCSNLYKKVISYTYSNSSCGGASIFANGGSSTSSYAGDGAGGFRYGTGGAARVVLFY